MPSPPALQHTSSPMSMSTSTPPTNDDPHRDSWYPYNNGAHFDGDIAMILIFIFCALICALALNAGIRFFLRHARLEDQQQEDGKQPQSSPSPLVSLPTLVFSSGTKMKLAGEAAECAICLSEFVDGEGVRILPKCKHGFHVKCIQGWLSNHVSCPTCRTTYVATPSPDRKSSTDDDRYDVESPPPAPTITRQTD